MQKPVTEGSRGAEKLEAVEVAEIKIKNDLYDRDVDKVVRMTQESWGKFFAPERKSGSERARQLSKGVKHKKRKEAIPYI